MNYLFFLFFGLLFLSGCSTKEVFEPENVVGDWEHTKTLTTTIVDRSSGVALLENRQVLQQDKTLDVYVEDGYRALGVSGSYLLTTNIDGNLHLHALENGKQEEFKLEKTIAAASTDGDVVAVVFANGTMALYKLATKELLLKLEGATSIAVDSRVVNPYFMNNLILFLTLDGKVVIVNKKLKKKLRTIIVSAEDYFNNVIYFDIVQQKLIVATATKILSFGSSQQRIELEARDVTHDRQYLYVATKQGDIVKLSPDLKIVDKVHFPFAHFLALKVKGDTLYALENEEYLIKLTKNLLEYSIYDVDFDDENYVYTSGSGFIIGSDEILLDAKTAAK